jgi:hypothetical protein
MANPELRALIDAYNAHSDYSLRIKATVAPIVHPTARHLISAFSKHMFRVNMAIHEGGRDFDDEFDKAALIIEAMRNVVTAHNQYMLLHAGRSPHYTRVLGGISWPDYNYVRLMFRHFWATVYDWLDPDDEDTYKVLADMNDFIRTIRLVLRLRPEPDILDGSRIRIEDAPWPANNGAFIDIDDEHETQLTAPSLPTQRARRLPPRRGPFPTRQRSQPMRARYLSGPPRIVSSLPTRRPNVVSRRNPMLRLPSQGFHRSLVSPTPRPFVNRSNTPLSSPDEVYAGPPSDSSFVYEPVPANALQDFVYVAATPDNAPRSSSESPMPNPFPSPQIRRPPTPPSDDFLVALGEHVIDNAQDDPDFLEQLADIANDDGFDEVMFPTQVTQPEPLPAPVPNPRSSQPTTSRRRNFEYFAAAPTLGRHSGLRNPLHNAPAEQPNVIRRRLDDLENYDDLEPDFLADHQVGDRANAIPYVDEEGPDVVEFNDDI